MKYFLVLISTITMFSCLSNGGSNVEVKSEDGQDYRVRLLFEVDGVKVYRFVDDRVIYFTNTNGNIGYRYTTRTGKTASNHNITTLCNSTVDSIAETKEEIIYDTPSIR